MEKKEQKSYKKQIVNVVLYLFGIVFMPLGVVCTINAHLGAGGYDALNFALGELLNINTSIAIYITSVIVILITACIRKGFPRFTTLISSFLLGISTDIWKNILKNIEGSNFLSSFIIFIIGIIILAISVASYISSTLPSNPTDDFVMALNEKGIKISIAKILLDCSCVVLALLMGGEIGLGTILCTIGLGPFIDFIHKIIKKHILSKI